MPTTEIFKLDRRHKAHREGFRVALRIRRDVHEIMDQGSIGESWKVYKRVEKLKDRLGQMYPNEGRWNPHHWASWRSKPRRDQKNLSSYMREGDYIIAVRNEHDITVLLMADPG